MAMNTNTNALKQRRALIKSVNEILIREKRRIYICSDNTSYSVVLFALPGLGEKDFSSYAARVAELTPPGLDMLEINVWLSGYLRGLESDPTS